jgi:hypothetical protein
MGEHSVSDLGSVLIGQPDDDARTPQWRQGVVTQASPLLVRVGAATTATPCKALMPAAVGDVVSVLVIGGDRLVLGPVATAWTQLPLVNGWTHYGAPYGPALYRRIGDEVQLRGLTQGGSSATAAICTLPVGFRPLHEPICATICAGGVTEIRVNTLGVVAIQSWNPPAGAVISGWGPASPTVWTSLAGVTFSVT